MLSENLDRRKDIDLGYSFQQGVCSSPELTTQIMRGPYLACMLLWAQESPFIQRYPLGHHKRQSHKIRGKLRLRWLQNRLPSSDSQEDIFLNVLFSVSLQNRMYSSYTVCVLSCHTHAYAHTHVHTHKCLRGIKGDNKHQTFRIKKEKVWHILRIKYIQAIIGVIKSWGV